MDFAAERSALIRHLELEIADKRVLEAIGRIPRERFVPPDYRSGAYLDEPLPIGQGQTISQPAIIALMTEALELKGGEKVLEVGTGSGYQSALLAELSREVITVERIPSLAESAKIVLNSLGYTNIRFFRAGKFLGWPMEAPYAAIIVTAGAPHLPEELLDQLSQGGRLVIPVGTHFEQQLLKVVKTSSGYTTQDLGGCRFVPLIGEDAWEGPSGT